MRLPLNLELFLDIPHLPNSANHQSSSTSHDTTMTHRNNIGRNRDNIGTAGAPRTLKRSAISLLVSASFEHLRERGIPLSHA